MGTTYGTRRGRLAVGVAPLLPTMLLVGLWLAGAAESASPTETLRATYAEANAIITALMTGQPPIDSFDALFIGNRLTAIGTLFSKAFDFRAAAERTLGAQWKARTAAEQKDFTALFANFVQRGFMSWLASVAAVDRVTGVMAVHYLGETVDRDRASVRTSIGRRGGGEVRLDHNMVYLNTRWVVRDVTIDGVSLVANYRARFERVIRTSSYQDLVDRIQTRPSSPLPTPASGRGEDLDVDRPSLPRVDPQRACDTNIRTAGASDRNTRGKPAREQRLNPAHRMTSDEVMARLRVSRTDLRRFVEAMLRDNLPSLAVPANAARAWTEREPQTWAMVCEWLAEQGKTVKVL